MRRSGGAVVLVVIGLACSPIKTAHAPADAPAPTPGAETAAGTEATWIDVANAEVAQVGAGRRLTLALTRTPEAGGEREMRSPPRLVLDLAGPRPAEPRQVSAFPLADELVSRVRVGSFGGKLRAIVDLSRAPGAHVVRHEGAKVIIDLGDTSLAAAAPARAARKPARAPVAAAPPAAAPPETPGAPEAPDTVLLMVRDVRVEPMGADRRLIIELTRPPDDVRDFALSAPPRLVMDLHGPLPTKPAVLTRFPLTDDVIAGVRVATNGGALRIVADLNRPARSHAVRREGNRLVADLTDTGTAENPPAHLMLFAEFDDAPAAEPEFDGEAAPPPPAAAPPAAERPARVAASEAAPKAKTPPATAQPAAAEPPAAERAGTEAAAEPEPAPTLEPAPPLPVTLEPAPPPPAHLAALPHTLPAQAVRRESSFTGQRISLDFKDADIQHVLRVLADVSGLNIIATEKVKGVLTDRGSVTFDDRTNTIIVRDIPHGTDDASQLIHELDVQSPQVLIEANIVEATRDVARALGVQWGYNYQAGPQTGNPTGLNFPGTVGVGGSGLNDGSAPAGANGVPRSPVPFLFDFPVGNGFSGFGAGNGSSLDVVLGSLDGVHALAARLTALEQQGKAKVISRPRVITLNNVAATIQSLTILRVKLPSTGTVINTGTGGAAGSASTATEKINTGITLVVTPQVSADGYVLMSIYAKSSQPDFTQGRSVDGIPNEISREANSNVLIQDGQTVVLGGIFRNTFDQSETGLPYLPGIPVLGWLFKRLQTTNHYEELLVFITPRIVVSGTAGLPNAERLWQERRHGG